MNKVFTLTIVPGTRHRKELIIVTAKPGVSAHLLLGTHQQMSAIANTRKADIMFLKDVDVAIANGWWQRVRARWMAKQLKQQFTAVL